MKQNIYWKVLMTRKGGINGTLYEYYKKHKVQYILLFDGFNMPTKKTEPLINLDMGPFISLCEDCFRGWL